MQNIKRTYSAIESAFHEKVSAKIRLVADGVDRFRVSNPFRLQDGDDLVSLRVTESRKGWSTWSLWVQAWSLSNPMTSAQLGHTLS